MNENILNLNFLEHYDAAVSSFIQNLPLLEIGLGLFTYPYIHTYRAQSFTALMDG